MDSLKFNSSSNNTSSNTSSSSSPSGSQPIQTHLDTELLKTFKSQIDQMTQAYNQAVNAGNTTLANLWKDKIDDLQTTIKHLSSKELDAINSHHMRHSIKSARLVARLVFGGVVHPATWLYSTERVQQADHLSEVKDLYRINSYLNSDLFIYNFFQDKGEEVVYKERSLDYLVNQQLNNVNEKIRDYDLQIIKNETDLVRIKNKPDGCPGKLENLETIKYNLELLSQWKREEGVKKQEIEKMLPYFEVFNQEIQEMVQVLAPQFPEGVPFAPLYDALQKHFEMSFKDTIIASIAAGQESLQNLVDGNEAKRLNFYTSYFDQIDGAVIYPKGKPEAKDALPWNNRTLILVGGNGSALETLVEDAKKIADKYGINVVIYNGPGVGYSMGKEMGSKDAVDAFKQVFKQINTYAGNHPSRLAVLGHSLGGGISIVGLGELAKEHVLEDDEKVGLVINYHSFSSLSGVAGGVAGSVAGEITKGALKFMGVGNLDAAQTLKKYKVTDDLLVATAHGDSILKEDGQMDNALKKTKTLAQDNITYVKTGVKIDKDSTNIIDRWTLGQQAHNRIQYIYQAQPLEGAAIIQEKFKKWADS